ncbi:MAG: ParA family protein [Desulfobacterales bacterium]|nr:ParA family protein [Desulfobacterales bacterium]
MPKKTTIQMPKKITIINVASIKGGVGKTAIALAIAIYLAKERDDIGRVLYLDTDFSGTCTRDGIGKKNFDKGNWRGSKEYYFLENLLDRIEMTGLKKSSKEYFERFADLEDKLWLAFSSEDHKTIREYSHFMDMEQYSHLILSRVLDLCWYALEDVDEAVIIMDNGPGIYGLEMSLLDNYKNMDNFIKTRSTCPCKKNVSVAHLFFISPDRQDSEGLYKLLAQHIENNKDKRLFNFYIALNIYREKQLDKSNKMQDYSRLDKLMNKLKLDEDDIAIPYLSKLSKDLFKIKEIEEYLTVFSYSDWLRLFLDPDLKGVSLWKDDEWKKFKDEITKHIKPITDKLVKSEK